ncbi:DNA polymerase IV [Parenemella sanctibonifatiensis]|uniref:DNA polymerase IV n=1 Tax=Parenemella sanctibonifatiensis TaxID=2016505 RepID=A0A255EA98_9ACTN|nr:DNA polymerase IV [Parenemella sanctibonifatiensis]OYN87841.1 DNA polymerase IV [Parenemella sanctibonifatiensis]OYN92142.1 DNA polymerase IV [Parenemella sanctibonifatiensis]
MRSRAAILHLDLDAFFASVEQRDKPSLRGKPVVVGGTGPRGVVSTASYEARVFGVHSAMPGGEARRLAPHAAFLSGRYDVYREASQIVMGLLRELSPLVEPLSVDEAFVDLAGDPDRDLSDDAVAALGAELRAKVTEATGGLTASVGIGSSKFIAKLASELAKPDGLRLVVPGTEVETIAPLSVRAIPGIGPVSGQRLQRIGLDTIADVQASSEKELVRELGRASGEWLWQLAYARDDRPVQAVREAKSISVEDTFAVDVNDRAELHRVIERDAALVAQRLTKSGQFAKTVTLKARAGDFTTYTRSRTLEGATDRPEVIAELARGLLESVPWREGLRLLGVGVSGFAAAAQEELFGLGELAVESPPAVAPVAEPGPDELEASGPAWARRREDPWRPGADVWHDEHGPGWVWGSGLGRVTVRFETAESGPGPVRTFGMDDPALHPGRQTPNTRSNIE